jgi:uncharacterized coiled-coil DUF342 family protein
MSAETGCGPIPEPYVMQGILHRELIKAINERDEARQSCKLTFDQLVNALATRDEYKKERDNLKKQLDRLSEQVIRIYQSAWSVIENCGWNGSK